jgi:phage/plasmid-like protein (TIGR03299 family)
MSRETSKWLNENTLIGFTAKRGNAWHYRSSDQGDEANHYPGAIPVGDVHRRLFHWQAVPVPMAADLSSVLRVDTDPDQGQFTGDRLDDAAPVYKVLPDRIIVVRSDTCADLGVFKSGYKVHQFGTWLVDNVATLLDGDLSIGSAGLLANGRQAWVQVERPETETTPEGVEFRPFVLAAASHDGSIATTYKTGSQLVVCDNTLAAGLRENTTAIKIKHTKYSRLNVVNARDALGLLDEVSAAFAAEVKVLCETAVTDKAWAGFLNAHCPMPGDGASKRAETLAATERGELKRLYTSDTRVAPWHGTAFGVLQAVNTYTHHHGIVRNVSRPERNMSRAVTGEIDKIDNLTVKTLDKVLASL